MHYYRYRPVGDLALKELLYDELYFASAHECNDPFDGRSFFSFGADSNAWYRLVSNAWRQSKLENQDRLAQGLADRIALQGEIPYSKAERLEFHRMILGLEPEYGAAGIVLGSLISTYIARYRPRVPYFCPFARVPDSSIMWSHYASRHEGHCLIYKAIDGMLNQCPKRRRESIERTGIRGGLAPVMQQALPQAFRFEDVLYGDEDQPLDAFMCFPVDVFGRGLSEDERQELHSRTRSQVLKKGSDWKYEKESRLLLWPPMGGVFGAPIEYSPQERLLHFQPTQLAGIVLGARMPDDGRQRIREVVRQRIDRMFQGNLAGQPWFNFVTFEATLGTGGRRVDVHPIEVNKGGGIVDKNDKSFAKLVARWRDGHAILFTKSGATRRQYK